MKLIGGRRTLRPPPPPPLFMLMMGGSKSNRDHKGRCASRSCQYFAKAWKVTVQLAEGNYS